MPLTFLSHQAVVLPLKIAAPRWTSGTALVLGSMAPDVEYFVRTYPSGTVSHTWPGQVTFCLPVTIALYWIVTRVVAAPLAAHLPDAGALRLTEYARLEDQPASPPHWLIVGLSSLVGSASHVVLDRLSGGWSMYAATEYGAFFPFSLMRADWHWVAFKLATWVLLALLTLAMMRYIGERSLLRRWVADRQPAASNGPARLDGRTSRPATRPASRPASDGFWAIVGVGAAIGGVLGAIFRRTGFFLHQPATWVHIGLAAFSAGFIGLVIASLWWRRRMHRLTRLRGTST